MAKIGRSLVAFILSFALAVSLMGTTALTAFADELAAASIVPHAADADTVVIDGSDCYQHAQAVVDIANRERAAAGVGTLTLDPALTAAAMQRAAETAVFFSHTRPDGASCFTAIPDSHRGATAENIAAGNPTPEATMNQWMNSSGHRANILNGDYNSIGVGCFTQGGATFWVQLFSSAAASGATPSAQQPASHSFTVSYGTCGSDHRLNANRALDSVELYPGSIFDAKYCIVNDGWNVVYAWLAPSVVSWRSSDPAVIKIDAAGKMTALKAGSATISGTLASGRSVSYTFEVKGSQAAAMSLSDAQVSGLASKTYTGTAIKPVPTVKYGTTVLENGRDFTLSYRENVNVGTATVVITGKGAYAGTKEATFRITPANLSRAKLTGLVSKAYTGRAIKQVPTVKVGSLTLKNGRDFSVSYKGNKKVGTATVTVAGKGNFTGSKSAKFKIAKYKQPMTAKAKTKTLKASSCKAKAVACKKLVTVKKAKGAVTYANVSTARAVKAFKVNAKSGVITVPEGTAKGIYPVKVKVVAKGAGSYAYGTKTVTVKIKVR